MCTGRELVEITLSGGSDTSDLLGGFEQLDGQRAVQVLPQRPGSCAMALQQHAG